MSNPTIRLKGQNSMVHLEFTLNQQDLVVLYVYDKDGNVLDKFVKPTKPEIFAKYFAFIPIVKMYMRNIFD